MKLMVVRHGETHENATGIVQGQLPGELTKAGMRQAEELAKLLSKVHFDQAWSSDLKRCTDTAKYIMKLHPDLKLNTSSQLRELNFGKFQGKHKDNVDWSSLEGTLLTRKMPHGESNLEMNIRVINFINELFKKHPNHKILIITHGGPIRAIQSSIEGISFKELIAQNIANASALEFNIIKPLELYRG